MLLIRKRWIYIKLVCRCIHYGFPFLTSKLASQVFNDLKAECITKKQSGEAKLKAANDDVKALIVELQLVRPLFVVILCIPFPLRKNIRVSTLPTK